MEELVEAVTDLGKNLKCPIWCVRVFPKRVALPGNAQETTGPPMLARSDPLPAHVSEIFIEMTIDFIFSWRDSR